jgi:hypothetical protein
MRYGLISLVPTENHIRVTRDLLTPPCSLLREKPFQLLMTFSWELDRLSLHFSQNHPCKCPLSFEGTQARTFNRGDMNE